MPALVGLLLVAWAAAAAAPVRGQLAQASVFLAQAAFHDRAALREDRLRRRELRLAKRCRRKARRNRGAARQRLRRLARGHKHKAKVHGRRARRHRREAARLRALAAAAQPPPVHIAAEPPRGPPRPLGTAVSWNQIQSDASLRSLFLTHFTQMTPENELKMNALEPVAGVFNFDVADQMVDWGLANGKRVRGHTLVFGQQLPSWLPAQTWTRDQLLQVMQNHITTVMQHFKDRVKEWDVVNEAIAGNGSYIPNIWYQTIGPDYVEQAFRFARAADPTAKLFYNDVGIDLPTHPHTVGVRNMLAGLKRRGVPVDAVGMENHVTNRYRPSQADVSETMRRFVALGLDVAVTEMDVKTDSGGTWADKLDLQRQVFTDSAKACRLQFRCRSFSTWGISDKYSWLGAANAPLLFDVNMKAKPAFAPVKDWIRRP